MSKMHGPDCDQVIHVHGKSYGTMTLAQLYDIIYDRLEYARCDVQPLLGLATTKELRDELNARRRLGHMADNYKCSNNTIAPLNRHLDVDALTQQCLVEVRKKLGLYKDELDFPREPPVTTAEALEVAKNTPVQRHWYLNDDGMWKETKKS